MNTAGVALTVTANNLNKIYGTALNFTGTEFTATGLQNGETIGGVVLSSPGAAAAASGASGGTFTPGNYTITYADGLLTVTPAPLTVRPVDQQRFMGVANPPFTATYTGFQLGQTPAALTGTLVYATPATQGSTPGVYPIIASGLTSTDYAIAFLNGTLTVTPLFSPTDLIVALQRLGLWNLSSDLYTCLSDDAGGAPSAVARKGVGARPPRNCGPGSAGGSSATEKKKQ